MAVWFAVRVVCSIKIALIQTLKQSVAKNETGGTTSGSEAQNHVLHVEEDALPISKSVETLQHASQPKSKYKDIIAGHTNLDNPNIPEKLPVTSSTNTTQPSKIQPISQSNSPVNSSHIPVTQILQ